MWDITVNMCGLVYDDLIPYLFGKIDDKIKGKCCCSLMVGFYLLLPLNFIFLTTVVCLDIVLIPIYSIYELIKIIINKINN